MRWEKAVGDSFIQDLKTNSMFIIAYRKIVVALTVVVMIAAAVTVGYKGLNYGIDFTGGSIVEISYTETVPSHDEVSDAVSQVVPEGYSVRQAGETGFAIRTPFISEEEHQVLVEELSFGGTHTFEQDRFSSIGPVIGNELKSKALWAIAIVVLVIVLFVAFAFRKVSKPVSAWMYGLAAIVALIHDMLIPTAIFALIGAEVDVLFITALLAILGFSVNDTIVVFDRIRENLKENNDTNVKEKFTDTVGKSVSQSFARSINTSLTTLVALLALYFVGGSTTQMFALTLAVGVIAGTYSSIFFASPLLVLLNRNESRTK